MWLMSAVNAYVRAILSDSGNFTPEVGLASAFMLADDQFDAFFEKKRRALQWDRIAGDEDIKMNKRLKTIIYSFRELMDTMV